MRLLRLYVGNYRYLILIPKSSFLRDGNQLFANNKSRQVTLNLTAFPISELEF